MPWIITVPAVPYGREGLFQRCCVDPDKIYDDLAEARSDALKLATLVSGVDVVGTADECSSGRPPAEPAPGSTGDFFEQMAKILTGIRSDPFRAVITSTQAPQYPNYVAAERSLGVQHTPRTFTPPYGYGGGPLYQHYMSSTRSTDGMVHCTSSGSCPICGSGLPHGGGGGRSSI